jgi:hypothetical protein
VPSVSPVHRNNPALKLLTLDPATFLPIGATTFYTTPDAAAWGERSYEFAADYGCALGRPLRDCVAAKPRRQLEAAMNADYTVRNAGDKPDWAKVDAAVDVNP